MFIVALFLMVVRRWKEPKCPSVNEHINKMNVQKDYYSAITRNKVLIPATTWMSLENMLSLRIPSQKITCYMILFIFV